MKFEMTHLFFKSSPVEYFTEETAPDWLTGRDTDFQTIRRIE